MSIGRIIDIEQDDVHLKILRGFLVIEKDHKEAAKIPLDHIDAVVVHAHGVSYTNNVLVKLASQNASFVFCGANKAPAGYLWPTEGYHKQGGRIDAQMKASSRMKDRLWKDIIRAKINHQAYVLKHFNRPHGEALQAMSARVKLGDPDNLEAQAARRYWTSLFGIEFNRDRGAEGINAMLNYGYTILRSLVARSIMACGLLPVFGLHHNNQNNTMRLVDDMMEPLRPFIDRAVYDLVNEEYIEICPDVKRALGAIGHLAVLSTQGETSLRLGVESLCLSLVRVYENGKGNLDVPTFPYELTP